ncbi:MAG: HAMP domain-containing protein [Opitutae bacterium]|nr:HAMP domain-containing protein [Opitutae bacterium]
MPFFRDIPLRRKLLYGFLLTTGVSLVAARLTFFGYEYATFRRALRGQIEVVGGIVAGNSTAAIAFENAGDAHDILRALRAEPHISAAALYKGDALFAHYPESAGADAFPERPGPAGFAFAPGRLAGFTRVEEQGRPLGWLYLRVDTAALVLDWVSDSALLGLTLLLLFLAGAYGVARWLTRRISEPILSLAQVARRVAEHGDYEAVAPQLGRDELGQLAADFNSMLRRIAEQDREIRGLNAGLERRVAERTTQLETLNRELEAFSYSVSHDLRAPLRHVDGFVQLLQQRAGPKLDDAERRYLGVIAQSARNMGVLIDELLAFSRMARTELRRVPVDTAALVAEVIRELQPPDRRIEWHVGALPAVKADAAMLRQVWRNLIGNAVKYTALREVATIAIDGEAVDEGARFRIADNGAGFDMKYARKLFGVFQRLHAATEFEGTGIGLANVRRIVERHGGRVWAEAAVDRGATFYFTLPSAETNL